MHFATVGTPGKAPVGYLNIRQVINGLEGRIVVIDPGRGPLMKVQALLTARNISGERRRDHDHYLKGSVFCLCAWVDSTHHGP